MKLSALLLAVAVLFAGCVSPQVSIPETPVPTRTIHHQPTPLVPFAWTEERAISATVPDPAAPALKRLPLRPVRSSALGLRPLPPDLPASWRHTLYHEGQIIDPRIALE